MGDLKDLRQNNQNSEDNSLFNQELVPGLTINIQNVLNEDEPTQEDLTFYIDQYLKNAEIDDQQLEEYLETIYPNPEKAPLIISDPRLYVLVEIFSRTEEGIELLASIQQFEIYPTPELQTVVYDIFKKRILDCTGELKSEPTDGLSDKQREKKRVERLRAFIEDKNDKYGDDYLLTKLADRDLLSYPQRFILFVTAYNLLPIKGLNENVIGNMGWMMHSHTYSPATQNLEEMISTGSHRLGIEYLNAIMSCPMIRTFELDKRDIYNFYADRYAQEINQITETKGVKDAEAYLDSIKELLEYPLVGIVGEKLSIYLPYTLISLFKEGKYEMLDSVVRDLQSTSLFPGMVHREALVSGIVTIVCDSYVEAMFKNESYEELSNLLTQIENLETLHLLEPRDSAFKIVYREISNSLRNGFLRETLSIIKNIEQYKILNEEDLVTLKEMYDSYTYRECEANILDKLEDGDYNGIKTLLEEDPYIQDLELSESQRMNLRAYVHGQITIKCQMLISEGKSRDAFELLKTTKTLGLYIDIDEELKKAAFN